MSSTILIIDDNKEFREKIGEILELANYNVFKAENGKRGIELAREFKPNLILCNTEMPEFDGYCALRALNNLPENAESIFIFMSDKADNKSFRKAMELGADDYLVKPFDAHTILKTVTARLHKYDSLKYQIEQKYNKSNRLIDEHSIQKDVKTLTENKKIKKVRRKELLFTEGDPANFLYLIISGKIKTFKSNNFGKEFIIDIHNEGDFLGYFDILEDCPHKVSAMAIEHSEIVTIPKQDFCNAIYSNSDITMRFVKMMSHQFSEIEEKLLKLAYDSARKRVAEAIIFVSKKYKCGENNNFSFCLHRDNISALSGISPESVSRNLSSFKEEGLIETINGNIRIKDLRKLEALKN